MLSLDSTKCMPALLWSLHTREKFCSDVFFCSGSFDKVHILPPQKTLSCFPFFLLCLTVYRRKKMHASLFASARPYLLLLPPLLDCVCFVLHCAPVHRKTLWLLKVRLLYWSTESKCMFPFVWHEQHTSPDKHTVHYRNRNVHQRLTHSLYRRPGNWMAVQAQKGLN